MSDDEDLPTAIPWYQSKVVRRLALSLIVQFLAVSHLSKYVANNTDLALFVDDLLEVGGLAWGAFALHARVTRPNPTIVASQKQADLANAKPPIQPPETPT